VLKFLDIRSPDYTLDIVRTKGRALHINFACLFRNEIIAVQGNRNIICLNKNGDITHSIGGHSSDIIAFNIDETSKGDENANPDKLSIASIDYYGTIRIWGINGLIEEIRI